MKGIVVNQVLSIILLVIAIAVVAMVIMQNYLLSSEKEGEFSDLFQKGIISTTGKETIEWIKYAEVADDGYEYEFKIRDLDFDFKFASQYKEFSFVAIADFKDNLARGTIDENHVIKYPADKNTDVLFNLKLENIEEGREEAELIHLTLWEYNKCIDDFFDDENYSNEPLSKLIERCPGYYISSIDVGSEWRGRALYVQLDFTGTELFRFHLTNNPSYEDIDTCGDWLNNINILDNNCLILTNEEDGFGPFPLDDECALTTVESGYLISSRNDDIGEDLIDSSCRKVDDACDILGLDWTDQNKALDECEKETNYCNLANEYEDKKIWQPKYDIVCEDGYWVVLKEGE